MSEATSGSWNGGDESGSPLVGLSPDFLLPLGTFRARCRLWAVATAVQRINLLSPRPKKSTKKARRLVTAAAAPWPALPRLFPLRNPFVGNTDTQTPDRRGWGAAPRGQEENSSDSEGALGPSSSAPPPRDPSHSPLCREFLYFFTLDAPADKGRLGDADCSAAVPGLGLLRNFARVGARNRDPGPEARSLGPRGHAAGWVLPSPPVPVAQAERTAEPPPRQACSPARQTVPGRPETYAARRPRGPTWCSLPRRFSAHQKPRLSSAVWATSHSPRTAPQAGCLLFSLLASSCEAVPGVWGAPARKAALRHGQRAKISQKPGRAAQSRRAGWEPLYLETPTDKQGFKAPLALRPSAQALPTRFHAGLGHRPRSRAPGAWAVCWGTRCRVPALNVLRRPFRFRRCGHCPAPRPSSQRPFPSSTVILALSATAVP
ncbi:uncharacterized protein [Manis javanica]|uniref:uncharacterized protein n=1 Tax=Manis javanica TaxID=9974 RepID=UPI003C6D074E